MKIFISLVLNGYFFFFLSFSIIYNKLQYLKVVKRAVSGMLPKNTHREIRLDRLKVFPGSNHTYTDNIFQQVDVPRLDGLFRMSPRERREYEANYKDYLKIREEALSGKPTLYGIPLKDATLKNINSEEKKQ